MNNAMRQQDFRVSDQDTYKTKVGIFSNFVKQRNRAILKANTKGCSCKAVLRHSVRICDSWVSHGMAHMLVMMVHDYDEFSLVLLIKKSDFLDNVFYTLVPFNN